MTIETHDTPSNAAAAALGATLRLAQEKIDHVLEILEMPCRDADEHAEILRKTAVADLGDVAKQVAYAKADGRRHRLLAIAETLRAAKNVAGDEIARIGKTEKPEDAR
jgi:hypothetical protein